MRYNTPMTLRKILIGLGLLIAFLPYLGFPQSFDTVVGTASGLLIVLLLALSRKDLPDRFRHSVDKFAQLTRRGQEKQEFPASEKLSIEKPRAPFEQRTIVEQRISAIVGTETAVEKEELQRQPALRRKKPRVNVGLPEETTGT